MKYSITHCLILILLLVSGCTGRQNGVSNFRVEPSAYVENLRTIGTVQAVKTNVIKSPPIGIVTVGYLAESGDFVHKGDTICQLESPNILTFLETVTQQLIQLKADKDKLEADNMLKLSLLEAKIESNNIQVELNSLDSVQRRFAPPLQQRLIDLQRQKAAVEKQKLEKNYKAQKRISETELRGLGFRIGQQENRLQRYQTMADQLIVTAPSDGIVLRTSAPTIRFMSSTGAGSIGGYIMEGSSVYSGMPLLEMPEMDQMQVSVRLPENEYKRVEIGQLVNIEIDAVSRLHTTGRVKRKLLSGIKASKSSNVKFYEVVVSVDSCHLRMKPGLSANCDIIVNQVRDTLVVPSIALFGENKNHFVYVFDGENYRKRYVETGPINSSSGIISRGLEEGEYIALSEPPPGMISVSDSLEKDRMTVAETDSAAVLSVDSTRSVSEQDR